MNKYEPTSALVLTPQEWTDLAEICRCFRLQREEWLAGLEPGESMKRLLDLCKRVQEVA